MATGPSRAVIHPYISELFYIPTRLLVGRVELSELEKDLTVAYVDPQTLEQSTLKLYRYACRGAARNGPRVPSLRSGNEPSNSPSARRTHIGVPREYGRTHFPDLWGRALDHTTRGSCDPAKFPQTIKPRTELQAAFIDAIAGVLRGDGPDSAQACARTGSGKTVSFIAAHAKVGLFPIIVCVHTNRLKNQWLGSKSLKKGLRYLFGDKWVNDNVGIVQQGKCDYVGKLIVVAMMPSLARRKYPKEFYRYFATMGIDEVHKCSAPTLSRTLSLFNCSKIVGLTATPRLGSRAKVINTHLGKSRITSQQEVLKPIVYRIHYRRELKLYADNRTALITTVARLKDRNRLLARILYHKGHLRGRQCLGLSDRTDQLLDIKRRLMDMGVPERDIGLYVGAHKTGRYKPSCTITWQGRRVAQIRGAPSFETKLEAQSYIADWKDGVNFYHHKTGEIIPWPKDVEVKEEVKHEMHKISEGEYSRIENECPYVLATWGIFDTGIDISRLDFGMELTPRGDVEQGVGRVLRLHEGKPIPEWVTIQDEFYHYEEEEFFDHVERKIVHAQSPKRLAKQRLVSYRKQSATLKDVPDVEKALAA